MTSRGPFGPKTFYDSVILWIRWLQENSHIVNNENEFLLIPIVAQKSVESFLLKIACLLNIRKGERPTLPCQSQTIIYYTPVWFSKLVQLHAVASRYNLSKGRYQKIPTHSDSLVCHAAKDL